MRILQEKRKGGVFVGQGWVGMENGLELWIKTTTVAWVQANRNRFKIVWTSYSILTLDFPVRQSHPRECSSRTVSKYLTQYQHALIPLGARDNCGSSIVLLFFWPRANYQRINNLYPRRVEKLPLACTIASYCCIPTYHRQCHVVFLPFCADDLP